ncbi:putative quinol monooxygenase [Flagellimonas lutimaris]|uniref:putative quinol monooxygenase n=1 Tax=Flagellimonas lutimaris TaxID=475082 RepID=UPI003F5CC5E4
MRSFFYLCLLFISMNVHGQDASKNIPVNTDPSNMLIRIAEIVIFNDYIDQYLEILKEESEASVRLEPGVLCIYPMQESERPDQIRLLEIYADSAAYQSHLKTPHFLKYKTSTLHMVKSLALIDMKAIDGESMSKLFAKINRHD